MFPRPVTAFGLLLAAGGLFLRAAEPTPQEAEFFEKRIRPLLADHCYKCHSVDADKVKGGLLLDSRVSLLKGGDTGPGFVSGVPEKSLIVGAVGWKNEDLQMPPKKKLGEQQIADLTEWVKMGAPWPGGDKPAVAARRRNSRSPTRTKRTGHSAR